MSSFGVKVVNVWNVSIRKYIVYVFMYIYVLTRNLVDEKSYFYAWEWEYYVCCYIYLADWQIKASSSELRESREVNDLIVRVQFHIQM